MNKVEGSTRYINLHVSYTVDTREDGNDYPGFFVVISENNNQNDFHYWMDAFSCCGSDTECSEPCQSRYTRCSTQGTG